MLPRTVSQFIWISGYSNMNYTNWNVIRPLTLNSNQCVVLSEEDSWKWKEVEDCMTQKRNYICELALRSENLSLMFHNCPYGYGDNCYSVRSQKLNWNDAEEQCQCYHGSHLSSVTSQGEHDFLSKIISYSGQTTFQSIKFCDMD